MTKTIQLPIYKTKVVVMFCKNVKKDAQKLYKKHNHPFLEEQEYRGLVFYFDIDCNYLLLSIEDLTHGLIAHETSHVLDDIFNINNIQDTEAKGFLCEFLIDEIYKYIKLKNIIIK